MAKKIIKTKREDAEAVLVNRPDLVAQLEKAERGAQVGKAGTQPLLIEKANGKPKGETAPETLEVAVPAAEAKHELAVSEGHDPDPEKGHKELKPSDDNQDEYEIQEFPGEAIQDEGELEEPEADEIIDRADEPTDKLQEKPRKEAKARAKNVFVGDKTAETPEEEAAETPEEEAAEDEGAEQHMPMHGKMMGKKKMPAKMEAMATEAMAGVAFGKALAEDPLVAEAREAMFEIYKALGAPGGGNVKELLAQGADFVGALRDYANVISAGAEPGEEGDGAEESAPEAEGGAGGTEAQAATQDLNPAPQPGQKVGTKPPGTADEDVLPEEVVQERPNMSEEQEEAVESPEDAAAETPADEAEEGRLHFAKIPTEGAKQAARQPPVPVGQRPKPTPAGKSVTARTAPNAEVKSAARHPAEAFLEGWSGSLVPVLKAQNLSRSAKFAAVQKALNEFGPAITEVINALTPPAPEDLTSVVEEAVSKAVAERDLQHARQLASIEAQLKSLQGKRIPEEIAAVLARRNGGTVRRSLAELPPPERKAATTPTEAANQLSTGLVVKGMSAGEVARASVAAGGPTIRY